MENSKLEKLQSYLIYLESKEKQTKYKEIIEDLKNRNKNNSVGLLGEFSSGKSTLINALLKKPILPSQEISTTGAITKIIHGDKEKVQIKLKNRKSILEILFKYRREIYKEFDKFDKTKAIIDYNFIDKDLEQNVLVLSKEDNDNYTNAKILVLKESNNINAKKEISNILNNYKLYIPIYYYFIDNFKICIDKITGEIKFNTVGEEINSNKNTEEIKSKLINLKPLINKHFLIMENIDKDIINKNINELIEFCEDNFPCEIIEEIIISTPELPKIENGKPIELIDLPGLNVINENHKEITTNISKEVSSFIIVEGEKHLEGDTKKIVLDLKDKNEKLSNTFYLIKNKYDLLLSDTAHTSEKEANFEKTRIELNIPAENTFKLSAYNALDFYSNNSFSKEKNDYVEKFEYFKKNLLKSFSDLELKFKDVVLDSIKPIKNDISNDIKNKISKKENEHCNFNIYASKEARNERKLKCSNAQNDIDKLNLDSIKSIVKWSDQNNSEIVNQIFNDIELKSETFFEDLSKIGKDINYSTPTSITNKYFQYIQLNEKIRQEFIRFMEINFYLKLRERLTDDFLNSDFSKYMNKSSLEKLESYTSSIKLFDRLSGIIDITLLKYQFDIEKIQSKIIINIEIISKKNDKFIEEQNLPTTHDIFIEYELNESSSQKQIYESMLKKEIYFYLNENITQNINTYSEVIIKNYLEEIKEFLTIIINEDDYGLNFEQSYKEKEENNIKQRFDKLSEEVDNLNRVLSDLQQIK